MLTILDVALIAHFGFGAHIPWWLWAWAALNEVGMGTFQHSIRKAAAAISKKLGTE